MILSLREGVVDRSLNTPAQRVRGCFILSGSRFRALLRGVKAPSGRLRLLAGRKVRAIQRRRVALRWAL